MAILALYHIPIPEMKLLALICNIIVVSGGCIIFIRNKQVNIKKIIPIVIVSIPCTFLGARLKLNEDIFFIVLGCSLIVAYLLLWLKQRIKEETTTNNNNNYIRDGALGCAVGFLSGMVGIGGGIFLSPVLNLMKWDTPKRIAATASVFILVNSIAGIAGQLSVLSVNVNYTTIVLLAIAVFIGGQIGSRTGAVKFNQLLVKRITAILVFAAGVEVLLKHIH